MAKKRVHNDETKRIELLDRYAAHREWLRSQGHDPDFIGTTEVRQVHCTGCGAPIPWRILRGWQ
jgi:hypothetical protein